MGTDVGALQDGVQRCLIDRLLCGLGRGGCGLMSNHVSRDKLRVECQSLPMSLSA